MFHVIQLLFFSIMNSLERSSILLLWFSLVLILVLSSCLWQDTNISSRAITEVKHLELNQLSDRFYLLGSARFDVEGWDHGLSSFQMGKTFWWVVSAGVEQSRRKANMVAQGDVKFSPRDWPQNPSKPKKKGCPLRYPFPLARYIWFNIRDDL